MNTLKNIALMALLAFLLLSCEGFGGKETDEDTTRVETAVDQVEPRDSLVTVEGVAVDGGKRNIIIEVDGDAREFELPYNLEVTYEIGDTMVVKYDPAHGDSVVEATNKHAQE